MIIEIHLQIYISIQAVATPGVSGLLPVVVIVFTSGQMPQPWSCPMVAMAGSGKIKVVLFVFKSS